MSVIASIEACLRADKVPYLVGSPGLGKSALLKYLASRLESRLFVCYMAQRAGNEIHGIPVVSKEPLVLDGRHYTMVEQAPPRVALEARNEKKGALIFFDEINMLTSADMGQMMSVFSERLWGDVGLPRQTISLAGAGNPPELSAGGNRLNLPARRRLVVLQMEVNAAAFASPTCFPDNWGIPLPPIVKFGETLDVAKRMKNRLLLASWVHRYPDCFVSPLQNVAKMYDGFVAPSTLEDAADLMAAVEQFTPEDEKGMVRQQLLRGCLGAEADSILEHLDTLDVPDARAVLDDPEAFIKKGEVPQLDKLYYFMMSLVSECKYRTQQSMEKSGKKVLEYAQDSWTAGLHVADFLHKKKAPADMVCMMVGNLLLQGVKPKGVSAPPIVDELRPLLNIVKASGVDMIQIIKGS